MKMYDGGLIIIGIVVGLAIVVGVVSQFFMGPDNPIEEIAEKIIESETGEKVDLSPEVLEGMPGYPKFPS